MDAVFSALQWIADFFGGGNEVAKGFVQQATEWVLQHGLVWYLHAKLDALTIAWNVSKGLLNDLGIAAQLAAAWSAVPAKVMSGLNFFHVPEAVSIMINAAVTRFVLRFVPGF